MYHDDDDKYKLPKTKKLVAPFDRGKFLGLLIFKKSDITSYRCQSTFSPSTFSFTRSLAFEFLRAGRYPGNVRPDPLVRGKSTPS